MPDDEAPVGRGWDAERFEPEAFATGRRVARERGRAKDNPYANSDHRMAEAWRRGFEFETAALARRAEYAKTTRGS